MKLRPRTRRPRKELHKCQDCQAELTDKNWTLSMQKYRRYVCAGCWVKRQKRYATADPLRREKIKIRLEKWKASRTPEQLEQARRKRYGTWIKRYHGITLGQYDSMLKKQRNKCAICRCVRPTGKGVFHVDHCHTMGRIRGLLCSKCNFMLGMAGDNVKIFKTAIKYLTTHRADHKKEHREAAGGKKY